MAGLAVRSAPVLTNEEVAPGLFKMVLKGTYSGKPAQFYMLRAWGLDPLLARPMSVFDRSEEWIAFLYRIRGRGTELLSQLHSGDRILLLGPLGNGWERRPGRVALIGGGSGVASLLHTAKVFGDVDLYLGFRNKPFLIDEFKQVTGRLVIASETGEGGQKGLVSNIFDPSGYDACYACGPQAMLASLSRACKKAKVPLFVSLEERMACGIGACLGCAVRTTRGICRVCRDGPVFHAREVIWDG